MPFVIKPATFIVCLLVICPHNANGTQMNIKYNSECKRTQHSEGVEMFRLQAKGYEVLPDNTEKFYSSHMLSLGSHGQMALRALEGGDVYKFANSTDVIQDFIIQESSIGLTLYFPTALKKENLSIENISERCMRELIWFLNDYGINYTEQKP